MIAGRGGPFRLQTDNRLPANRKTREFPRRRKGLRLLPINISVHRPANLGEEPVDLVRVPFNDELNSAISKILHVAGDRKPRGNFPRGVPEANPLDATAVVNLPTFQRRPLPLR